VSAARMILWFAIVVAASRIELRFRQAPAFSKNGRTLLITLVSLIMGGACCVTTVLADPLNLFQALPIALLCSSLLFLIQLVRRPDADPHSIQLSILVFFVFALASLLRILLRCSPEHYGFYLMAPGLLAFAVFWSRTAPGPFRQSHARLMTTQACC